MTRASPAVASRPNGRSREAALQVIRMPCSHRVRTVTEGVNRHDVRMVECSDARFAYPGSQEDRSTDAAADRQLRVVGECALPAPVRTWPRA